MRAGFSGDVARWLLVWPSTYSVARKPHHLFCYWYFCNLMAHIISKRIRNVHYKVEWSRCNQHFYIWYLRACVLCFIWMDLLPEYAVAGIPAWNRNGCASTSPVGANATGRLSLDGLGGLGAGKRLGSALGRSRTPGRFRIYHFQNLVHVMVGSTVLDRCQQVWQYSSGRSVQLCRRTDFDGSGYGPG